MNILRQGRRLCIFADEAGFDLQLYQNSRFDRIIKAKGGDTGVDMKARARTVMVAGFWVSDGSRFLVILLENTGVNQVTYCNKICKPFFRWFEGHYNEEECARFVFFQDSAPPHSANDTQDYLTGPATVQL